MRDGPPYLSVAALAQHVEMEENGRVSVHGLWEELVLPKNGDTWAGDVVLWIVIIYRSGIKGEPHELRWDLVNPDGSVAFRDSKTMDFTGTANFDGFIGSLPTTMNGLGEHWLDVYLDGVLETRVPFVTVPIEGMRRPGRPN